MTYCAAINVEQGLVMVSDSRTNAGADHVSTYSKTRLYGIEGERQLMISWAGNLATTQGVVSQIERDIKQGASPSVLTAADLEEVASYIGRLSVANQRENTGGGPQFEASFLVAGEIAGAESKALLVYPEGNFISTSRQTPFLQVGETKYGKPILDRAISIETDLERAALCALVSMEGTMRSNLTVGPPIELQVYESGSLRAPRYVKFGENSPYLSRLSAAWNALLVRSLNELPPVDWLEPLA